MLPIHLVSLSHLSLACTDLSLISPTNLFTNCFTPLFMLPGRAEGRGVAGVLTMGCSPPALQPVAWLGKQTHLLIKGDLLSSWPKGTTPTPYK